MTSTNDATDSLYTPGNIQTITPSYISAGAMPNDGTDRVFSRQLLTGNMRGVQNITGSITITNPTTNKQNISIDGTAQAITVTNTDGSVVGMGLIPNSADFGFYAQDAQGNLLYKIVGSTIFAYDITHNTNVMQILKLPDGTYGWAVANVGENVADGYN